MYHTRSPTHKSRSSALARAGMTKELTPAEGTAASRCPGSSKLRTAHRQRTHMLLIMSVGRRSRSPWRPRPRWRWTSWRGLAGSDVGYCTSWGMCASVAGAGSDPIVAVRKPDHEIGHACAGQGIRAGNHRDDVGGTLAPALPQTTLPVTMPWALPCPCTRPCVSLHRTQHRWRRPTPCIAAISVADSSASLSD